MAEGKKPHLSASQITRMMECGEAWRLKYVEKKTGPSTYRAAVGSTVHEVVATMLREKRHSGNLSDFDVIPDMARSDIAKRFDSGEYLPDDPTASLAVCEQEQGQAIDRAIGLSILYRLYYLPTIEPIEIEQRARISIDGFQFDIVVVEDIVTANAIRDTKTSARAPAADAADQSFQLALYAIHDEVKRAFGGAKKRLILDYLIATPKWAPGKKWLSKLTEIAGRALYTKSIESVPLTPERKRLTLAMIERTSHVIQSGSFMPNPSSWLCNMRYCEFARSGKCLFFCGRGAS